MEINDPVILNKMKSVKERIEKLIEQGRLKDAKEALDTYEKKIPGDTDIWSMRAVIFIMEGKFDDAEFVIKDGLKNDSCIFDLLFNLAYISELKGKYQEAAELYLKADTVSITDDNKTNIRIALENIKTLDNGIEFKVKKKLVFFVKKGMDSFIGDIVNGLSSEYNTRKMIVDNYNQIDEGMKWADICWFEWCDELIGYGSKLSLAIEKKVICRLHSYEAFTNYPINVNWDNVDKLIFVAEHIKDNVLSKIDIPKDKVELIYNGIDLNKFPFKQREKGFNIAYVGYINYKKGPMLLIHAFKAIHDRDKRYKLYIAGEYQEERYILYFNQMINELGLKDSVIYEGWQKDINSWLEDKNYIICSSVLEGNPVAVMEGMARGIKPLIHNFVGAKKQFGKYVWSSIDECVSMVLSQEYNPQEYRDFITKKFSLEKQITETIKVINQSRPVNNKKIQCLFNKFDKLPDDISNAEVLFNYLIDVGDEKRYISVLEDWFVRSNLSLEEKVNYFNRNLYRRFDRYTRFEYLSEKPYKLMEQYGEDYFNKLYTKISVKPESSNEKTKVLFVVNGLDYVQIINRIIVEYVKSCVKGNFEYYILSLSSENEFVNGHKSLAILNEYNINYYLPRNREFDKRIEEFYKYICNISPNVIILQSFYFHPMNAILYPLYRNIASIMGRFIFQQPEDYFDKKIDFLACPNELTRLLKGNDYFCHILPCDTDIIDQNINIRDRIKISESNKIVISVGRDIKYHNRKFWNLIINIIDVVKDICFVFFGPELNDYYKTLIPDKYILQQKIILCGVDLNARAYLKSCDYYINSSPISGGITLLEAYYANLPIIMFMEDQLSDQLDTVNPEVILNLYPNILYDNPTEIFPQKDDYSGMLDFSIKLITNNQFKESVEKRKRIKAEGLTYKQYAEDLQNYLLKKLDDNSIN